MASPAPASESPRAVANKSSKRSLLAAIRMALRIESPAVRHNTQTFNRNRYAATAALPDYNELKDRARAIKESSIANLPDLITTLEASVKRNGGHFYLAPDAQDATRYIADVCTRAGVRLVVKGKSMTSEEVGLNHVLQGRGIEVAETDLAEFILQVADEQPSHIIAPAIHYSRERITALFKSRFKTDLPLDTGEELTRFAREHLRQKFLAADAGISGANLIAADSGSIVLVESEGNIRLTTLLPPLHIAIAGVEKIIPSRTDFGPFLELLAASGTGQKLSSYTSIITPPLHAASVLTKDGAPVPQREFHLVLVDNGRMKMRQDPVLHEALYCIRCSACLNSCANFQTVGGHAFGGETYSGGIGGSWEAGTRALEAARFNELCTGCSRCVSQCPVRIDIPFLNSTLRQRLNQRDAGKISQLFSTALADDGDIAPLQKLFFGRYDAVGKWGSLLAPLSNWINAIPLTRFAMEKFVGLDRRRELSPFAKPTLVEAARNGVGRVSDPKAKVILFADIFTNYGSPARGLATLKVLQSLGIDVAVSETSADGRAALSQGLIATAAEQARRTAELLRRYIVEGRDVVVIEPSVLAMFRLDYHRLLTTSDGQLLFELLRNHSFDAVEYLWMFIQGTGLEPAKLFPASRHPLGKRLFYHSHCQQKTIGSAPATEALLLAAGFEVATSRVECCGMAGSFGYKKEYYDLSMAVGQDLFKQVAESEADGPRVLVASGTSCHEQLQAGLKRQVFYPTELLDNILQTG
jgi:iron-sulfur cluster protein